MAMLRTDRLLVLLRWPLWRTLGLELLIVFVGMAGAFFVNDLQQERAKQKAVREALVAIHADLRQYARNGQEVRLSGIFTLKQRVRIGGNWMRFLIYIPQICRRKWQM